MYKSRTLPLKYICVVLVDNFKKLFIICGNGEIIVLDYLFFTC